MVGRSVNLFGALSPNRTQTMTLTCSGACELNQLMGSTTAGALIPEIVRRGFQELLEAGVSSLTAARLHERCPDQRSTHRNGYRRRLLTTQVGDLTVAIPLDRRTSACGICARAASSPTGWSPAAGSTRRSTPW